jgi:protein required for attachment to host cells
LANGSTWFPIADGRRARVLIEARRGAQLETPADLTMEITEDELYDVQDRPPRSFDSVGPGRHAMDKGRNLHEQEEVKVLNRVASTIVDADRQNRFDHLVIAAPPRALGMLREKLAGVQSRIRAATPKDLLDEPEAKLRERLR